MLFVDPKIQDGRGLERGTERQSLTDLNLWAKVRNCAAEGLSGSTALIPLFEYRDRTNGRKVYSTETELQDPDMVRSPEPLCRVWPNPIRTLPLDFKARPIRQGPVEIPR